MKTKLLVGLGMMCTFASSVFAHGLLDDIPAEQHHPRDPVMDLIVFGLVVFVLPLVFSYLAYRHLYKAGQKRIEEEKKQ